MYYYKLYVNMTKNDELKTTAFVSGPLFLFLVWGNPKKATTMDAIKKKMQAMKLEKDNAADKADAMEGQAKDANLRAEKVWFLLMHPRHHRGYAMKYYLAFIMIVFLHVIY